MLAAIIVAAYLVVAHADYGDSRRVRIAPWKAAPMALVWPAVAAHLIYRKFLRLMRKP